MSQHTPGPWYATASAPEGSVFSHDHELIVPWSPLQSDRKMANARLIAAAPEMLDALRELAMLGVSGSYKYPATVLDVAKKACALLARIEKGV